MLIYFPTLPFLYLLFSIYILGLFLPYLIQYGTVAAYVCRSSLKCLRTRIGTVRYWVKLGICLKVAYRILPLGCTVRCRTSVITSLCSRFKVRYLLALISIALRASVVPYLGLDQSHLRTNSTVLTIPYWEPTKDILSNKYGTHIVAFEYFSFFSFGIGIQLLP